MNRRQEDFERGWSNKETTAAAALIKANEDRAVKDANEKNKEAGEEVLYSDEYYAAQRAKRQGLDMIKFIDELFKLQMPYGAYHARVYQEAARQRGQPRGRRN